MMRSVLRLRATAPRPAAARFLTTGVSSTAAVGGGDDSLSVLNSSHSWGTDLIPEDVVRELNKYIVGQEDAKKAVAIALRNRWRRRQLKDVVLRAEISPMNILMSGPTGSGKTEIARRLAKMTDSPFLKVEATKYTEVGIYGANTESMIKDLVDVAVDMERDRAAKQHAAAARERAINRLVDLLSGPTTLSDAARESLRDQIGSGQADNRFVNVKLKMLTKKNSKGRSPEMMEIPPEIENMMQHLDSLMKSRFSPGKNGDAGKTQRLTVKEALPRLEAEEADDIIDEDEVVKAAIEKVQNNGIIFLDEIDKLANASESRGGGNYRKGEGVQKELLALTEGCAVSTRYGLIYTDHILFIASGAFHNCKPSDLMPELQGRLPIRVALSPLGAKEFVRILKETEYSLLLQTRALMATEGVELSFTDEAVDEIAEISAQVNSQTDDIGARRLATIVSKITEEVSFHAPKMGGIKFEVDQKYVRQRLANVLEKTDLTKYIL
uniref:AAA+ ATPase domain-containing protein n=1 Tax=Globisporangium ultimum (strain ATCC 200006 / CBS 805.95 / DAOM BR144) TaxID=431595 RepID=K3X685_GLOUD